jgi:inhibitor of cysteine peptidase
MRKKVVAGLAVALLLPLALVACRQTQTSPGGVPPLDNSVRSINIEITYDEFLTQPHVTKTAELTYPGSLIVTLGSNPTTGFQWAVNPTIGDPAVIQQYEHNFVSATSTAAGAPGKDVWTFKPLKAGTTVISFDYSRPWEGGEKGQWTLELTVVVR